MNLRGRFLLGEDDLRSRIRLVTWLHLQLRRNFIRLVPLGQVLLHHITTVLNLAHLWSAALVLEVCLNRLFQQGQLLFWRHLCQCRWDDTSVLLDDLRDVEVAASLIGDLLAKVSYPAHTVHLLNCPDHPSVCAVEQVFSEHFECVHRSLQVVQSTSRRATWRGTRRGVTRVISPLVGLKPRVHFENVYPEGAILTPFWANARIMTSAKYEKNYQPRINGWW